MSNKKQTAVTFLESTLIKRLKDAGIFISKFDYKLIEQAKAMEKKQIQNAHQNGFYCGNDICNATTPEFESSEQYYLETYEQ